MWTSPTTSSGVRVVRRLVRTSAVSGGQASVRFLQGVVCGAVSHLVLLVSLRVAIFLLVASFLAAARFCATQAGVDTVGVPAV